MKKQFMVLAMLSLFLMPAINVATSHDHHGSHRPDEHAPAGVTAGHTHKKGEWMMSYKYMWMEMNEILEGSTVVNPSDVHNDYMVSPTSMTMGMQMGGLMYAPSDKVTLMTMVPVLRLAMDHKHTNGSTFTRSSNGLGDIKVMSLINLKDTSTNKIHGIFGISLPSGSIGEKSGQSARLPYPMQLGSGTYDLNLGAVYTRFYESWSFGVQPLGIVRLGENKNGYTLGDSFQLTTWASKVFLKNYSSSFRVTWKKYNDIDGSDDTLNTAMVPTATTDKGGESIELGIGVNAHLNMQNRLIAELSIPVSQKLNGVQLGTNSSVVIGWQYQY
jgi:hypothetical protein